MALKKILILGGYGTFGKRIAEGLIHMGGVEIIIAGRDRNRAERLVKELGKGKVIASIRPAAVNIDVPNLAATLYSLGPDLVVHTAGPFQAQDYRVPLACIAAGCHYIDLADDRRFVCDIGRLDEQARQKKVLLVSGASSVPGLTSTAIDRYRREFSQLDTIDFCIVPGYRAERGEATVKGILSYTGHPFQVYADGTWQHAYGWLAPRKLDLGGPLGRRWLANVDIPDLELFPRRYQPVRTVRFQAGIELPWLHWAMVLMAVVAKAGLVHNWSRYIKPVYGLSQLFNGCGTDTGGMRIQLNGFGDDGQRKEIKWTLIARNGIGPYVPTLSAIILARKIVNGQLRQTGAMPCLGLYTLDEFDEIAAGLGISHTTEIVSD